MAQTNSQRRSSTNSSSKNGGGSNGDDRSRKHGRPDRQGSSRLSVVLKEMHETLTSIAGNDKATERERKLQDDNFKLRRRNARLLDELESGDAVPEGSHVVTDDEMKELEAFREFKLKPADMKKLVDEHASLKVKQGERDAEQVADDAADALDVVNVSAFRKLLKREALHVEFKDERQKDSDSGKTVVVRVPYCRKAADDKAALVPLADYIEDELAEFIPSLNAEPEDDGDSETADDRTSAGSADRSGHSLSRRSARESASTNNTSDDDDGTRRLQRRSSERSSSNGSSQRTHGVAGVSVATTRGARAPSAARALSIDEQMKQKQRSGGVDYSL